MKRFVQIILLVTVQIVFLATLKAQIEFLVNPSLEGDDTVLEPYDWETCREENAPQNEYFNDPNFAACRTFKSLSLCNIDGQTFCLMRTRSDNYSNPERSGTYEHISSQLTEPFVGNNTYKLDIWLVTIYNYGVSDIFAPDSGFPLRFQVYGAFDFCTANEEDQLVDTLIENDEWELYSFNLKPKKNYDYIYFRVYWDDKIMQKLGWKYNGMMLLDGSSVTLKCESKNLPDVNTYYKYYQDVYLNASYGVNYNWISNQNLSALNLKRPKVLEYDSMFTVNIEDRYGCKLKENHRVLLNCDSLYIKRNENHPIIKVLIDESIELTPTTFINDIENITSFNWSPSDNLSCFDCQATEVNVIKNQVYLVEYTDEMNCVFTETFPLELELEIPNVITPALGGEGDGKNDFFKINGLPVDASIKIFLKSGNLIFEAKPFNKENWWNGTDLNGEKVPTGTYWYTIYSSLWGEPLTGFVFVRYEGGF